jgi:hypothetical protein
MEVPEVKFKDLSEQERKIILAIIRVYCKENVLFEKFSKEGMGIEDAEELMIEMIDDGELKILWDEENDTFAIGAWDEEEGDYV